MRSRGCGVDWFHVTHGSMCGVVGSMCGWLIPARAAPALVLDGRHNRGRALAPVLAEGRLLLDHRRGPRQVGGGEVLVGQQALLLSVKLLVREVGEGVDARVPGRAAGRIFCVLLEDDRERLQVAVAAHGLGGLVRIAPAVLKLEGLKCEVGPVGGARAGSSKRD